MHKWRQTYQKGTNFCFSIQWIKPCNDEVKEIWVPSQFNIETFSKCGVPIDRLYKVPEPLDVHSYNPDTTGTLVRRLT